MSTYLRLLLVLFHNRYRFETPLHLYPKPQYLNILQVLLNIKECYCNLKLLPIFRSRQIHSFLYSDRLSSSGHLKQISWITPEPTVWRGVPSWTKLRIRKRISRYVETFRKESGQDTLVYYTHGNKQAISNVDKPVGTWLKCFNIDILIICE